MSTGSQATRRATTRVQRVADSRLRAAGRFVSPATSAAANGDSAAESQAAGSVAARGAGAVAARLQAEKGVTTATLRRKRATTIRTTIRVSTFRLPRAVTLTATARRTLAATIHHNTRRAAVLAAIRACIIRTLGAAIS